MSTSLPRGNVAKIFVVNVSVDLSNNPTITTAETDVTVNGVLPGDLVVVNKPSHQTGITIGNARVKSANTISIQTVNPTAGAINPTAETYTMLIVRPEGPVGSVFNA